LDVGPEERFTVIDPVNPECVPDSDCPLEREPMKLKPTIPDTPDITAPGRLFDILTVGPSVVVVVVGAIVVVVVVVGAIVVVVVGAMVVVVGAEVVVVNPPQVPI
jgi:hypothetical protein